MKTFHCTHCQNLVFFENVKCLSCERALAYLPDQMLMAALEQRDNAQWHVEGGVRERTYRLCDNYLNYQICNWAIPTGDPDPLCRSCRLTTVIPDLAGPGNQEAWYRLETAKRRVLYSLLAQCLPVIGKSAESPSGLAFEFLNDSIKPNGDRGRVMTGHDNGLITINVAEADDVYREQQRQQQREPYRTLLGHFRHEIGHYYWDQLVQGSPRLDEFRRLFGDERADYTQALKQHYDNGPPADWEARFVSAYASTHPWEDWAESWAHVLHMCDALETSKSIGLSLQPRRDDEPSLTLPAIKAGGRASEFEPMIEAWLSLTYALNNLARGLGLPDSYPFVLSRPVIEKLRFVFQSFSANSDAR
jgi:hypothetical protein